MTCWYLTNDLMFSSRVSSVAQRLARPLDIIHSQAMLLERLTALGDGSPPTLVLIDLSLPGLAISEVIAALKQLPTPPQTIAYGPHVHEGRLAEAQAAGCDAVLARGQFDRQMEAILRLP